ncbi:MAG: sigma factor [Bacteroidales bacterium]
MFKLYYNKLLIFANGYLQNINEAKEVVQASFVKGWKIRHQIPKGTNINSYLYRMVSNKCLDFLKHDKTSLQQ